MAAIFFLEEAFFADAFLAIVSVVFFTVAYTNSALEGVMGALVTSEAVLVTEAGQASSPAGLTQP